LNIQKQAFPIAHNFEQPMILFLEKSAFGRKKSHFNDWKLQKNKALTLPCTDQFTTGDSEVAVKLGCQICRPSGNIWIQEIQR
jgi:hypothetical protein